MFTFDINHNHEIASEIIEHKGQAFSFEKRFTTKEVFYDHGMFGQWRKSEVKTYTGAKEFIKTLPRGVVVEQTAQVLGFDRSDKQLRNCDAKEVYIDIVTMTVPEEISWEFYYNTVGRDGIPFMQKLLGRYPDLLQKVIAHLQIDKYRASFVSVFEHIIYNGDDDSWTLTHYRDYGMENLTSLSQCYGFALALGETLAVAPDKHPFYYTDRINYTLTWSHGNPGIAMNLPAKNAVLNKW